MALSIVWIAIENVFYREVRQWRLGLICMFGLIHGLGFTDVFGELQLSSEVYFSHLLGLVLVQRIRFRN